MKNFLHKNFRVTDNLTRWKNFTIAFWLNIAASVLILWLGTENYYNTIARTSFTALASICFLEKWVAAIKGLAKWLAIILIITLGAIAIYANERHYLLIIEALALIITIKLVTKNS